MSLVINFVDSSGGYLVAYITDTTSASYFNIAVDGATPNVLSYLYVNPNDMNPSGTNGIYKRISLGPLPVSPPAYTVRIEAYGVSENLLSSAASSPTVLTGEAGIGYTYSSGGGGGGGVPCFPAGVRIRTPHGEKPVESLRTGDLILTATGHAVPIRMYSYEIASATKANAPYFIPAGALGPKAPAKPLHLSPLHAFQIRPNVWWNAQEAAKASEKVEQYGLGEPLTYYHVECPNFLRDNLVADGVVVESFAANQLTPAQKHHLYTYSKKLGGFVRNGRAVM